MSTTSSGEKISFTKVCGVLALCLLILFVIGLIAGNASAIETRFHSPRETNTFPLRYMDEVPEATKIQLESDLERFFSMTGSNPSPLYKQIFKAMNRKASQKWFFSRVSDVGQNLCTSDSAVACVLSAWDNYIFLSPNYTKFDHPAVARIMVLFHEARHTESGNGFWPHATCPKNYVDENGNPMKSIWTGAPLASEKACDLDEFGSYGIATILLLNIAYHCDNCSAEDRREAEIYGRDQLRRITWKPAADRIRADLGI